MIATAFAGCTGGALDRENAPPQAVGEADRGLAAVGEAITFDASDSTDADGEVSAYRWAFGDGDTAEGARVDHAYDAPGHYVVTLTVADDAGAEATNDARLIYVTVRGGSTTLADIGADAPPVAALAADRTVVRPGDSVAFDAGASGAWMENPDYDAGAPLSEENAPYALGLDGLAGATWDFGDGATATCDASWNCTLQGDGTEAEDGAPRLNHTWTAAGLYPVTLTVTDAAGRDATFVYTVRVLPEAAAGGAPVKNPHVFTTVTAALPNSLDPAYGYVNVDTMVTQQVYETLVGYARDSVVRLRPMLATELPTVENGGVTNNGTTYTFHLREGVTFHDGTAMTASDVQFSLNRLVIMAGPPSGNFGNLRGAQAYFDSNQTQADRDAFLAAGAVEVVDDHTVRVHLTNPDPAFLYKLAFTATAVVSEDYVKEHAGTDDGYPPVGSDRDAHMWDHTAGTGPFMLDAWLPNQMVVLTRNDDYWGDAAALEKVIIQKMPDLNTRILSLLSGDADDAYIPVERVDDVTGVKGVEVIENPTLSIEFIGFNRDVQGEDYVPRDAATDEADPAFFQDAKMREAWVHAFDYATWRDDVLQGHGYPLAGPIPKGLFGHDADLPLPQRDLEAARAALAESNHPDGFTVTIPYFSGSETREKEAHLLKSSIEAIDPDKIDIELVALDVNPYVQALYGRATPVTMVGWAPDWPFPDSVVPHLAHHDKGLIAPLIGYRDPALMAMIDNATSELDEDAAAALWSDIQAHMVDTHAYIWLSQSSNIHVQRTWVEGYYYNPLHGGNPTVGDYSTIRKA